MAAPLGGQKVLITREKKQAKEFARKVSQYGGIPVEVPLLKISCKYDEDVINLIQNQRQNKWLFFTSANGVDCFFQILNDYHVDQGLFSEAKFAVVGRKTARALESYGYRADFMPTTYNAETMTNEFFAGYAYMEEPVLLVRGNWSRNELPDWFQEHGIQFQTLEVYETGYHFAMKEKLNAILTQNDLDVITFTSPSSVDAFMKMKETKLNYNLPIACIGTTTEKRASEAGFVNLLVPDEFTIDGMLARMGDYFEQKG
ncbi:uroporphyrinogen-III synthase [Lentibacillus sp. CBA3610]|uniref:uroporphyrinogen-III synthase n=1 Tax=Lentibacillus sp. CBA3610 TaxID=2518176 RepID=UPI0015957E67|nr:uroporphyrinogen-III synthase [Lentibacillus sp. CBA3610]QKY69593.1 uroporphyrinogen-III synthase [Lentibacillus sp. CBA3610]